MKILFLCNEGFDTPGPSNHLISTLLEDALESNLEIFLIQSKRNDKNKELPLNLEFKNKLEYTSVIRKRVAKNSFIKRYLEEIHFHFKCLKYWRNRKDFDLVFVQSCPTAIFPILFAKILTKIPIVYSVQDIWPGSALGSGVMKEGIISTIFTITQKIAYKYSTKVTAISEDMKAKLVQQGVENAKIETIVNWYDDRSVSEISWEENRFVKKYNLSTEKFYVQYAGTMGYVFDYGLVLYVAEKLKSYKDIEFHMIGYGSQKEQFLYEAQKKDLSNIIFFPIEPQNMVSDVYSSCSICLIPLKKGVIGNSVPSKAGLLMACNRAVVNSVDPDSDYYRIFNEEKIGISVSNEKYEKSVEAILKLYSNRTLVNKLASRGHNFGRKYYAREKNTIQFINLFKNMIREGI